MVRPSSCRPMLLLTESGQFGQNLHNLFQGLLAQILRKTSLWEKRNILECSRINNSAYIFIKKTAERTLKKEFAPKPHVNYDLSKR